MAPDPRETPDPDRELLERRERIRREMGGRSRIEAVHRQGKLTAREQIGGLLDEGSFREIGTFARSDRPGEADATPGDGKIVGRGTIEGRPVVVIADDHTVKRASSSIVNARKIERVFAQAVRDGVPVVIFGETAGARIPDIMGAEGFSAMPPPVYAEVRRRAVPMVTVITGDSFGGSSFFAAASDLVVQLAGTCLAVTAPRVLEVATGETPTMDELGGPAVHARVTGQNTLVADDAAAAHDLVRRFLGYLPSNAWTPPPRAEPGPPPGGSPRSVVPTDRRRGYDMRRLVRLLADEGSVMELMPAFGRSLVTSLARLDGHPVGILASQPLYHAGVLEPDACDKATRLLCLCDAFGLPLVFLHDTPGFMVGTAVEHRRLLHKATLMWQAVALAGVPKLSVVVRKSYGVAHYAMCGVGMGADLLCAWPGAEISFMDPETAANVLVPRTAAGPDERAALVDGVAADVRPYGAAGIMRIDEVIHPDSTRSVLIAALEDCTTRRFAPGIDRVLASWPTAW